jgi:rhodanese-related sulfurtransferase
MFHGDPLSMEVVRHFVRDMPGPAGRPVIVFGDGPFGWRSYNAALQLKAAGVANVIWYRGGEEAWTASGLPADSVFPKLPG